MRIRSRIRIRIRNTVNDSDYFFHKFAQVKRLCSYCEIDRIQNQIREDFFGSRSSLTNNSGYRIHDILSRDSWLSASTSITIPPGSAVLLEASLVLFWQNYHSFSLYSTGLFFICIYRRARISFCFDPQISKILGSFLCRRTARCASPLIVNPQIFHHRKGGVKHVF
jgi:hypothetical protein